jgi:phosphomevalonate kinase
MKIETTASGKVFLSGEYMALEGGRAIVLSTPQKAKISIIPEVFEFTNSLSSSMSNWNYPFILDENLHIQWLEGYPFIDSHNLGSILKESIKQFDKCFSGKKESIKQFDKCFVGQKITIDTAEFFYQERKMGIGSSSAVSVAMTKALNQLFDLGMTSEAIINHAREIHIRAQRTVGSGIDIIASFKEGRSLACRILKDDSKWKYHYHEIELPRELKIIVVANDAYVKTSGMVASYEDAKWLYKDYFSKHAPKMKHELELLYGSILRKDSKAILQNLRGYNDLLVDMDSKFNLGIFNNHHELIKLAKDYDVFYKPSGSGGGDIGIVISDNKLKLDRFCEQLNIEDIKFFEI